MRSMLLSRMKYIAIVASLAVMAVFVAPAAAEHFDPNSSKSCGTLISGQVDCTLTIAIDDFGPGVLAGQNISVALVPGTTGATYASASYAGGTCVTTAVVTITPTTLTVDPSATVNLNNCTIIIQEVLNATSDGTVGQTLNTSGNAPPHTVNATIQPGPVTADDCKKGGWESYGVFKNQGDCVSYVATNGRNAPAGA